MLTRDVRLEGFTTSDWVRLGDVLRPQSRRPREHESALVPAPVSEPVPRGGIIAVTTGPRLRKLLSTQQGRLDPAVQSWPVPLSDLAKRHAARWSIELGTGALDELMDRFAVRLRKEQVFSAQVLEFVAALRELEAEGAVRLWPPRLDQWPMAS